MRPTPAKSEHSFRNGIKLKTNMSHFDKQNLLSFRMLKSKLNFSINQFVNDPFIES